MAIAAVIVLHGRVEKSNFIDIQGEKKKKKKEKKEENKKKSFRKKMKLKHGGEKSTTRKGKKKDLKVRDIETDVMGGRDMVGIKEKKKHWQVDC